jgi:hypothetical protein
MTGRLGRPYPGHPGYIYYNCPHNPQNPRHQAAVPDHPRTVRVREDDLLTVIREFFAARIFGPDRAAMLAARLPASAADDTARREQETARLHKDSPAITALRSRIIARFGELETERTEINERLAALERSTGQQDEPACWTDCPCSATSSPTPRPASKPACSPPSAWN